MLGTLFKKKKLFKLLLKKERLILTLNIVLKRESSVRAAALRYEVNKITLGSRMHKRLSKAEFDLNRQRLSSFEEQIILDYIDQYIQL